MVKILEIIIRNARYVHNLSQTLEKSIIWTPAFLHFYVMLLSESIATDLVASFIMID